MLGGDGGTQKWVGFVYVLRGFLGGDVFHHDFEFGEVAPQGNQLLVNENGFAVKQINVGTGHFAMDQEQHASALHGLQCGVGFAHVGHARIAIGGSPCGVEFGGHHARIFGAGNFGGRQVVGQVQRHQRLKRHARRHSGLDAGLVGQRLLGRGNRGLQVGHDDGTAKLGRSVRHYGLECSAIAHMQVPVVGPGDGDGGGEGRGIRGLVHGQIVPKFGQSPHKASYWCVGVPLCFARALCGANVWVWFCVGYWG